MKLLIFRYGYKKLGNYALYILYLFFIFSSMHNQAIFSKYPNWNYPRFMALSSFGYTIFLSFYFKK